MQLRSVGFNAFFVLQSRKKDTPFILKEMLVFLPSNDKMEDAHLFLGRGCCLHGYH